MKRILSISTIAAALMFGALSLQAKTDQLQLHTKNDRNVQASKHAVAKEVDFQKKAFKTASKDIMTGLQNTMQAIDALQKDKTDAAKAALKKATQAFDAALKADPSLKLVPVENAIDLAAIEAPTEEIQKMIDASVKLLKSHKVQDAKALLQPLTDEIDIDTVFIPMDLYPVATKMALEALDKGDKKGALLALTQGLSTMVHTRVVIPLGLLTAQDLVITASKLDKSKKKEATALLDAARKELAKARLLGYVSKHDKEYRALEAQIKNIQKEIKGKNAVEKLYEKLKKDFASLLGKTRSESVTVGTPAQKAAEEKVLKFEKEENKKALKERKAFLQEAMQDKSKTMK